MCAAHCSRAFSTSVLSLCTAILHVYSQICNFVPTGYEAGLHVFFNVLDVSACNIEKKKTGIKA